MRFDDLRFDPLSRSGVAAGRTNLSSSGHAQRHRPACRQGLIQPLDFGNFILLQPEQINNYGSAVVRAARDYTSELVELPERAILDGEIEFKNEKGEAGDQRLCLQLNSGDGYSRDRKRDGTEVFDIKKLRHAEFWQAHNCPVMLVIGRADEKTRWMNVTDYLKRRGTETKQIIFEGDPFTTVNVHKTWWQMMEASG